ncbi:caspase-7-like [Anopheles aquasalis]|uniref:caspase-7-like n=1 Tax=Anopheles aquasalis TaxID=42839 RepID=UPI00215AD804|nr:caspase-7-like [Anopheles aquasalis]
MANEPKSNEAVIVQSESMQTESEPTVPLSHLDEDDPDEEYSMNHEKRGIAIVINQERFNDDKNPTRHGTNKDRDDVCAVLEKLQFKEENVYVLNDFTKLQLFKKLDEISKLDHTNHDCLVVVVMTHGYPDKLCAKDGAYDIDKLWNKFTGDSCKTLDGKPKLFFIQACRGKKFDDGVKIVEDTVDATVKQPASYFTFLPTEPDILVMFSTYDGHYSWRNPANGSWFIQSLCAMLNSHGQDKELLRILTAVSENVAYNYISHVEDPSMEEFNEKKQMPTIISMLTKAVYFRPK